MGKKIFILIIFLFVVFSVKSFGKSDSSFISGERSVSVMENELLFKVKTNASTVGALLEEQGIYYKESDQVIPGWDENLYPESKIIVQRSKEVSIYVDDAKIEGCTLENSVGGVFEDLAINLQEEDIVEPGRSAFVYNGMEIKITRVEIREEKKLTSIDFETEVSQDSSLGWREEKGIQTGKKGERETVYKVVYHNGKEISRKQISSSVKEDPITRIVKKGTYVKIGNTHRGQASWYDQTIHRNLTNLKKEYPSITGYYTANPWLPKGTYVKVTNRANGKSVIAKVNDSGPFVPGRIIDLDKSAFAQIASPYTDGVIDIKMEEIIN